MEKIEEALSETKKSISNIKFADSNREERILKNQLLIIQMMKELKNAIGKVE